MKIIVINGPNLNLLGVREPKIYGDESFETFLASLQNRYSNVTLEYFQSNVEGEIINKLQAVGFSYDGIILNAGGYTHSSVAILDAIHAITTPVVEVHISNILNREDFRRQSLISGACIGSIIGFGLSGYRLALESFLLD